MFFYTDHLNTSPQRDVYVGVITPDHARSRPTKMKQNTRYQKSKTLLYESVQVDIFN